MGRSQHIKGFDGLRALAVLAVFAAHRTPLGKTNLGHIGVLLFFALSGYLIVGILHRERQAIEGSAQSFGAAFASFFRKRTLRIFPIYYLSLLVLSGAALLGVHSGAWRWESMPWHFAYLSNVYEARLGAWQGNMSHLWSLAIEEQFYLVAAPALLFLRHRWHLAACVAAVLIGYASHIILAVQGANEIAIHVDSLTNFAFLAMGGALRLTSNSKPVGWATFVAGLGGAGLLGLGLIPTDAPRWVWELRYFACPVFACAVVLSVAKAGDALFLRFLEHPRLIRLGQISYGFYLYHNLFYLRDFSPIPHSRAIADFVVNFAITYAVAAVSFDRLERPLIEWSRRTRRTAPPARIAESGHARGVAD